MRKVVVYSVPRTGTRFVMSFLTSVLGYKKVAVDQLLHDKEFAQFHSEDEPSNLRNFEDAKGRFPAIYPLRDPISSLITYRYIRGANSDTAHHLLKMWDRFYDNIGDFDDVYWLPVDGPFTLVHKVKLLKGLCDWLGSPWTATGVQYAIDWFPYGTKGSYPEKYDYALGIMPPDSVWFLEYKKWYDEKISSILKAL